MHQSTTMANGDEDNDNDGNRNKDNKQSISMRIRTGIVRQAETGKTTRIGTAGSRTRTTEKCGIGQRPNSNTMVTGGGGLRHRS